MVTHTPLLPFYSVCCRFLTCFCRFSVGLYEYKTPSDVPVDLRHQLHRGLFPPTPEEAKVWNLQRCMRIMPQDMDTGGFFVAVFRKMRPIGR